MAGSTAKAQVVCIAGFDVLLTRKRVRNINLRVRQDATIAISAPPRTPLATIEQFVSSRSDWIRQAQQRVQSQQSKGEASCVEGQTVYLWGQPLMCSIVPAPSGKADGCVFDVEGSTLRVHAGPRLLGEDDEAIRVRTRRLERWLRDQLSARIQQVLPSWSQAVGKRASAIRIRSMRSRWGSCNVKTAVITINAQLVHHDPSCLDYVIVHELCHLHEPTHNARFHALMDHFYPTWRAVRAQLNGR